MSTKGKNVLALHGFTGCGEDFARFSPLCRSVDTWHCPNLPGHGPSPQLDCSALATIEMIERELSNFHSRDSAPNILLGYSMGARAALLHATRFPEKWEALILISANPGIEEKAKRLARRETDETLAAKIESEGIAEFLKYWEETPLIQSQKKIRPDWREAMQANRQKHDPRGLARSLQEFGQGSFPNLWPKLNALKMPILLISGSTDHKYSKIAERLSRELRAAGNRDVQHTIVEGCSHMPHLESPEFTSSNLDIFLSNPQA